MCQDLVAAFPDGVEALGGRSVSGPQLFQLFMSVLQQFAERMDVSGYLLKLPCRVLASFANFPREIAEGEKVANTESEAHGGNKGVGYTYNT